MARPSLYLSKCQIVGNHMSQAQMSLPFMLQLVTVSQFPVSWHVICAGEGVPSYPTAQ